MHYPQPKMKRGKQVRGRQPRGLKDFIKLIDAFGFEHHQAPGEAEAELAHLSKMATIDVILSDDVDSLLFGGVKILRNWSLTLSGNSSRSQLQLQADGQNRTHDSLAADDHRVETYTLSDVHSHPSTAVTPAGLILVALLAGGDYHPVSGKYFSHYTVSLQCRPECRTAGPKTLSAWREQVSGRS